MCLTRFNFKTQCLMVLQHRTIVDFETRRIAGDQHGVFIFECYKHFAIVDCPLGRLLIFAVQLCATPLSPFKGVLILAQRCHLEWNNTSISEGKGHSGAAHIPQTWSLWKTLQFLKSYWHSVHYKQHTKHPELYAPDRFPSVPRRLPYRGLVPGSDFTWFLFILQMPRQRDETLDTFRLLRQLFVQFLDTKSPRILF
jgi:hypothetical protein